MRCAKVIKSDHFSARTSEFEMAGDCAGPQSGPNLAAGGHSNISRDVNYGRLSGDLTLGVGEMLEGSY